ncbi:hypothetical protein [Dactylosporangium sp. CA-233914]|uniref:hypothetical protein n=1 Tax=Dactylosporangium sp. CA-233914 TaxID=3239934 RepID=UPI003D8F18D3
MRMRWPIAIAAWLTAAALATAASLGAVGALQRGLFGPSDPPLTEADVEAKLSSAPPATSSSPAPVASPVAPSAVTRALSTGGGSMVVSCSAGEATLMSWMPVSGYEADHVQRGPASVVSLRFKARSGGGSVRAQVTCAGGEPTLTIGGDD